MAESFPNRDEVTARAEQRECMKEFVVAKHAWCELRALGTVDSGTG